MSLAPEQITIIEDTWRDLSRDPDAMVEAFYDALFRAAPEVKPLFAGTDMRKQGRKLAAALNLVVGQARDLPKIVPVLQDMGRRHVSYGAEPEHYDAVGAALLSVIESALDRKTAANAIPAWAAAYGAVAGAMLDGAEDAYRLSA